MKKLTVIITSALMFATTISKAQTTATDFNRHDCNGNGHHLFQDLDDGKAVVLFFYMPNCGSCPPPAKKIHAMIDNFHKHHPGAVRAYLMPYNNTTKCMDVVNGFITAHSVSNFTPMDSGSAMVAYYGGFGMPTAVLLGGKNHRVILNSNTGFSVGDTTTMRDSIMKMMGITSGINNLSAAVSSLNVFPNPASDVVSVSLNMTENITLSIEVTDVTGKKLISAMNEKVPAGGVSKQVNTTTLPNGNYLIRVNANGSTANRKITITH